MHMASSIRKKGWLTKPQLDAVVRWKSPRNIGRAAANPEVFLKEVSGFALASTDERARISSLTLLDGVQWPTASVILHLFHREPYPILDFRALWSISTEVPSQYSFDFWQAYTDFCRKTAGEAGMTMRNLDRALWQYSKDNQAGHSAV